MGDPVTETSDVTVAHRPPGWAESWTPVPDFSSYEASNDSMWAIDEDGKPVQVSGGIRSIDRTVKGRSYKGTLLRVRLATNSGGYGVLDMTDDQGVKHKGLLVHRVILRTYVGECPPGMETRHLVNNPLDCRWAPGETAEEVLANGGNIIYGKPSDQPEDQFRNGSRRRAEPKPDKHCAVCDTVFTTNGNRCHPCVVSIGEQAAVLLWQGVKLDRACELLSYPSAAGLHHLACKYGGYGRPSWTWRVRRWITRRLRHAASPQARPECPNGGDSA